MKVITLVNYFSNRQFCIVYLLLFILKFKWFFKPITLLTTGLPHNF